MVITVVKGNYSFGEFIYQITKTRPSFYCCIMGILAAIGPMLIMVTMAQQKFQQFSDGLVLVKGNIGKLGGGLSKLVLVLVP